jgi:hypothetical protein
MNPDGRAGARHVGLPSEYDDMSSIESDRRLQRRNGVVAASVQRRSVTIRIGADQHVSHGEAGYPGPATAA